MQNSTENINTYDESRKRILIVDDEKEISDLLIFHLGKEGYSTITAEDGEKGLEMAISEKPDLIILDIMLPKMDGLTVCKKVRQKVGKVPIIMVSAKGEEIDKVLGLEIGADDYVSKPFSVRELVARVKANLRKVDQSEQDVSNLGTRNNKIIVGDLCLDLDKFEVEVRGQKVTDLTRREFEVLKYLAQKPGQVVTRENLLEKVWGYEYYGDIRTVDVTIRRIREKIEKNTANPKILITKRGVGYYIESK